ncbi:hypothetical protein LVJ85_08105 [Neisseria sp. Dent CA1/247]|uniref:hypothetical protein n=1 Tax=Neisseria sp. Dent CA1/247 TaxID=2912675 RepID=UPI001FD4FF2C|nr:hypothetical protein [Neisseria sp. Dent CA1/247]UOO76010.1 hypothetical protein LVJ85_08105 [Neisseria sp. Dent CA1/247]
MCDKKDIDLINSLSKYLNGELSGEELLLLWENAPTAWLPIYYNLCHFVADEDIRSKDKIYGDRQMRQFHKLLNGLKNNESIEILTAISFLE